MKLLVLRTTGSLNSLYFPFIISSSLSSSGYLFWLLLYFSFLGSPYALHLLFFYFNMVKSIISYQDRCRNMEEEKTEQSLF